MFFALLMIYAHNSQAVILVDGSRQAVLPDTLQCLRKASDVTCNVRDTLGNTGCAVECSAYVQVLDADSKPRALTVYHKEYASYPETNGGVFTAVSVLTGAYALEAAIIRSKTKSYSQGLINSFISAFNQCE